MQAEKSQIPVKRGQRERLTTGREYSPNALWAYVRRLKARVEIMETGLTTARRDINRIDKKQYRDIAKEPPAEIPPPGGNGAAKPQYDSALFGGV